MGRASVLDEEAKDVLGEDGLGLAEVEVVINITWCVNG
jgi:hypothetical protein